VNIRILVADDFAPWHRFVTSVLSQEPGWHLVCEVSDGLEAVQKAHELQPDVILLDLGLPKLNGIEAARQIRKLAPRSKILILSTEDSLDIVGEALSTGASGYVVKADAGSELVRAVEAVFQGNRFLSGRLRERIPPNPDGGKVLAWPAAPAVPSQTEITRCHEVHFYSDDASFVVGFAAFIEGALCAGDRVIAVVTKSHHNALLQRLQGQGLNIGAAIRDRRYIPLDVAETVAACMVNDLPDPIRFMKVAGDLITAAAKAAKGEHARVRACGECAPFLWTQGKAKAAIEIEHLWDEVAKTYHVDILCGYVLKSGQRERESHIYQRICAAHSTFFQQ
jgi:DNA-binding NarL/FixJ family response regulator